MGLKGFSRALAVLIALGVTAPGNAPLHAAPAGTASLTIVVENLRSSDGFLHVAIWDTPDGFGNGDLSVAGTALPAADGSLRIVFDNLPPGRYAIAAYHDENGNGKFDRTAIGLPAEGLGFSNDAWLTLLGAPSFEQAAIELDGAAAETVITLRY